MTFKIYTCPKCEGFVYQLVYFGSDEPKRKKINRKYCPNCDIILLYDEEKK